MSAASRADISDWFDEGVRRHKTHLIVACDTYEYEDYPVYASSDQEAIEIHDQKHGRNLQRVMEVYDLRNPKASQMSEHRAYHLPARV